MSKEEEEFAGSEPQDAAYDEDEFDDEFEYELDEGAEERLRALELLYAGGDVTAAFGEPVTSGDYTVIPAAEVAVGGGFGSGWGHGPRMLKAASSGQGEPSDQGRGGGGGGGGGSNARPVAVIVIGPDGVSVRPVFDYTKIGLALATALGAMWMAAGRMRRMGHMRKHGLS
jgi:uncharacterized spore protein YtfJ